VAADHGALGGGGGGGGGGGARLRAALELVRRLVFEGHDKIVDA
jgi:hypothetical protein